MMKKKTLYYVAPDIDSWKLGLEGLLCQSSGQLEDIVLDDSEGIDF
jgi:hypothetical protein